MSLKIRIFLALAVFISCGAGICAASPREAANGFSINSNEAAAVKEAVGMIRKDLKSPEPDFAIAIFTSGYDAELVAKALKETFPGKTKIVGVSSSKGVFDKYGYHRGKKGDLGILAVSASKKKFGIGAADMDKMPPFEAGKKAVQEAMASAGETKPPSAIIMFGPRIVEEEEMRGIESVAGVVPLVGASHGHDITPDAVWSELIDGKIYHNAIVLAAIYTKEPIGTALVNGYQKTGKTGTVTKSELRRIYEIDNRPAGVVYNEWTGGKFAQQAEKGGEISDKSTYDPLLLYHVGKDGIKFSTSMHPEHINEDKSLNEGAVVKVGDQIELGAATAQQEVDRCKVLARTALQSSKKSKSDASFALIAFCGGTQSGLTIEYRNKIPGIVNKEISEIPYIGWFAFGEQGSSSECGYMMQSLGTSMIVVNKEK